MNRAAAGAPEFNNGTWGVPLTDAEADEASRRAELPEKVGVALARANLRPDYAGAYLDHANNGMPVLLFATSDVESVRDSLRPFANGEPFETRSAARSLADLERIRVTVESDRSWFKGIGVTLVSTGIDMCREGSAGGSA
jgi:hypothetical protein